MSIISILKISIYFQYILAELIQSQYNLSPLRVKSNFQVTNLILSTLIYTDA
jgi:hypothetical protein